MKKLIEKWKKWSQGSLFRQGASIIIALFLIGLMVAVIQGC